MQVKRPQADNYWELSVDEELGKEVEYMNAERSIGWMNSRWEGQLAAGGDEEPRPGRPSNTYTRTQDKQGPMRQNIKGLQEGEEAWQRPQYCVHLSSVANKACITVFVS